MRHRQLLVLPLVLALLFAAVAAVAHAGGGSPSLVVAELYAPLNTPIMIMKPLITSASPNDSTHVSRRNSGLVPMVKKPRTLTSRKTKPDTAATR